MFFIVSISNKHSYDICFTIYMPSLFTLYLLSIYFSNQIYQGHAELNIRFLQNNVFVYKIILSERYQVAENNKSGINHKCHQMFSTI